MNKKQRKAINEVMKEVKVMPSGRKVTKEVVSDKEMNAMLKEKLDAKDRIITNLAVGWTHAEWLEDDLECLKLTVDSYPTTGVIKDADGVIRTKAYFESKLKWLYFKLQETRYSLQRDMMEEDITMPQINKRLTQLHSNMDELLQKHTKA